MPFLNFHLKEEGQTENLETTSVENQEKVLERILEGMYFNHMSGSIIDIVIKYSGLAM